MPPSPQRPTPQSWMALLGRASIGLRGEHNLENVLAAAAAENVLVTSKPGGMPCRSAKIGDSTGSLRSVLPTY